MRLGWALAGLSLAAGCNSAHGRANSSADAQFIAAVQLAAPGISSYRSNTELIRLGHAACDDFSSGASYEELADRLALQEGSQPLPPQDLGAVITAAVGSYCPKFLPDVS